MKATHKGTCQICERIQKLPREKMSKHGYTVDFGYFQGVCHGASCLPFEESCEVLRAELIQVGRYITKQKKKIAELRTLAPKDNKSFMSLYHEGRPVIQQVTFYLDNDSLYFDTQYKKRQSPIRYGITTLHIESAVRQTNAKYADHLAYLLKGTIRWAKRAQERCDNWKHKPLIPLTEGV